MSTDLAFRLLPDFVRNADTDDVARSFLTSASVGLAQPVEVLNLTDPDTSATGTCELANPQAIRAQWLGWLAWLVGVDIAGIPTTKARDLVGQADLVQRRGTRDAIRAAVERTLSNTSPRARVWANISGDDPYLISIVTTTEQTPDAQASLNAALTEKPAGMVIELQTVDAGLVAELGNDFENVNDFNAFFSTVDDVNNYISGGA